jgi:hypothetical protein
MMELTSGAWARSMSRWYLNKCYKLSLWEEEELYRFSIVVTSAKSQWLHFEEGPNKRSSHGRLFAVEEAVSARL